MTTEAVQYSKEQSTDIVYKKKKRLAKSGKDSTPAGESLSPNEGTAVSFHGNLVYPKW